MGDVVPEHLYMLASPRPALTFPFFLPSHPPPLCLAPWKAMTRSSHAPVFRRPNKLATADATEQVRTSSLIWV